MLYSVEVPCERNMWCFLTQRSLRNLINMVLGLLGGPSTLFINGDEEHNRSAFASMLENQSHPKGLWITLFILLSFLNRA